MKRISIPERVGGFVLHSAGCRSFGITLCCECDGSSQKGRIRTRRVVLRLPAQPTHSFFARVDFLSLWTLGHRSWLSEISPPPGPSLHGLYAEGPERHKL